MPSCDTHYPAWWLERSVLRGRGSYGRVEYDRRSGTGSAVVDKGQREESESSKQGVSSLMMTSIWEYGLVGLLLFFFGVLLGTTWTIQAVNQQYRRLAIERRELNERNLKLQQTNVRCARCGRLIVHPHQRPLP